VGRAGLEPATEGL